MDFLLVMNTPVIHTLVTNSILVTTGKILDQDTVFGFNQLAYKNLACESNKLRGAAWLDDQVVPNLMLEALHVAPVALWRILGAASAVMLLNSFMKVLVAEAMWGAKGVEGELVNGGGSSCSGGLKPSDYSVSE